MNLISFSEIAKSGENNSEWFAVGDDGKQYAASYVRDYLPDGVMFFAIPSTVKILGYIPRT